MGEKRICRCRPRIGNPESAPMPRHGLGAAVRQREPISVEIFLQNFDRTIHKLNYTMPPLTFAPYLFSSFHKSTIALQESRQHCRNQICNRLFPPICLTIQESIVHERTMQIGHDRNCQLHWRSIRNPRQFQFGHPLTPILSKGATRDLGGSAAAQARPVAP